MKKSKKIVVANWKMEPESPKRAEQIFENIRKVAKNLKNVTTIIAPPYIYISLIGRLFTSKSIELGAQDVHFEDNGSHTGEVSASMLKSQGVRHVIIGHSERRALGETNEDVNKKIKATLKQKIKVILCVGEEVRDDDGKYLEFIREEIASALQGVTKKDLANIVIAYEPIWAIGKEKAMNPNLLHEMSIFIRKIINDKFGNNSAMSIPVLYGGSVNPKNARSLMSEGEVQGLLIGRESLKPASFDKILELVDSI